MKTILRRIAVFVLALLVAGLIGEGAIRLFHFAQNQPERTEAYEFPCYTKGSYYWVTYKKNAICTLHAYNGDFPDLTIHTNSLGLRSSEIPPKDPSKIRILFLGDSFTFGIGMTDEKTYVSRTAAILKESSGKNIEPINAGLITAETGYYYLFLKNEGAKLQPDVVVIGFYVYNDAHDEEVKPVWTATDDQGLPTSIDSSVAYPDYTGILFAKTLPINMKLPILRDSKLIGSLTYAFYSLPFMRSKTMLPLVSDQLCVYKPDCHTYDGEIDRTKNLLRAINGIAATNNQKLLVVLIPAEFQIYDLARYKFWLPTPLTPAEKEWPNTLWGDFLKEEGIHYIDLLPLFVAHKNTKMYFDHDDHWNSIGHQLAAQAISEKLTELLK